MAKLNNYKYIILHHSLTKDSKTVSWNAIRKWHKGITKGSKYKFDDIGYHYGVELVGKAYEVFKGRSLLIPGAHTKRYNHKSIGICCVGNYDTDLVPVMMYDKLIFLLHDLINIHGIKIDNIRGHRDFSTKSCPGINFDLEYVRDQLRQKQERKK